MAAGDAARRQPATAKRAVALERLHRVRGTGGIIATGGGQQGREYHLVGSHEANEQETRRSPLSIRLPSRRSFLGVELPAGFRVVLAVGLHVEFRVVLAEVLHAARGVFTG